MAKRMTPGSAVAAALLFGGALWSGCGADVGPRGTTGSAGGSTAGTVGADGTAGTAGATGAAGTTAASGATGAAGTTAASGATGAAGTAGTAGISGAAGTTGASGTTGAAGTAGAGGITGAAGSTGAAGNTGASGTTGAAGATGGSGTGGAAGARAVASGTIVPLYTDPGDSSWTAIVAAQLAHPTVHVVAIVNPNSGPGASRTSAYTMGIAKLVAAKIGVIGYVATGYASHSIASMEAAIDQWKTFYPQLGGIFFDEQSNLAADVAYYRTLSQYAKAQGLAYTVGNPGTDTAEAFVGALDTMLIYESKGVPAVSKLAGWHAKYAPTNFGVIPYGTAFDASFVQAARKDVGYIYLQSDDLPNPWDTLPAYFGDLLTALE